MRAPGWVGGLLRRRPADVAGAAVSIALAVAFIAALGAFVTASRAGLTVRAAASTPVDWQVQLTPQAAADPVRSAVQAVPDTRTVLPVDLAVVTGLQSTSTTGTRSTGRAWVVALPAGYPAAAPAEIRLLLGRRDLLDTGGGVFLQQQTAANLAAEPGSRITVAPVAGPPVQLTVGGVVDLPQADSFFQVVGAPAGAGATAPPDNVIIVPAALFPAVSHGAEVVRQLHVQFRHDRLPTDPAAAAALLTERVNHFQVQVAGGALVGNNLGAALSAARQDAIYAQLLFLLLGVPGVALAAIVAALVVAMRGHRRRREVALLRLRGASTADIVRLVASETALTAAVGIAGGIPLAALAIRFTLPAGTPLSTWWAVGAAVAGAALAATTQLWPAAWLATDREPATIAPEVASAIPTGRPWPLRLGLDYLLLAAAAVVFALTARGNYQVVVVPEGIPVASINYAALLGPALAWPGLALLVWRISDAALARRTGRWARDVPGRAPELEAAGVRRRRRTIARGAAGLAVAVGLAASTATFTATYDAQARLDVALTVGADVSVTEPPGAHTPPRAGDAYAGVAGVAAIEPLQHRLAYVGPDLQDLFGIRPQSIRRVAPLSDSFVPGSTIDAALRALAATPDGVLLSGETLKDYQLRPGDTIRLRLQAGSGGAYRVIGFHVVGQVHEFPSAPKDSFIVGNADYIARSTGSDAVGAFLIRSDTPAATAAALRRFAGPGVNVADIVSGREHVTTASGLASTDLAGLARLELAFGLALAVACSGLALALGISERKRALVLLTALGATGQQRGRFLAAEARAVLAGGLLGGALIGSVIAYLLVKVLTGIFDPAPTGLDVPAGYLSVLVASVVIATIAVLTVLGRTASRAGPSQLRDL